MICCGLLSNYFGFDGQDADKETGVNNCDQKRKAGLQSRDYRGHQTTRRFSARCEHFTRR